jgi:uncharacterized protein
MTNRPESTGTRPEPMTAREPAAAATVFTTMPGYGPPIEGAALVSRDAFSPRYDLDRDTGVVSRAGHDLEGRSIAGMIVVVPAAKGGVAAGWSLYDLKQRGIAPLAFVFTRVNPVFVQGCVHAGIPIVHGVRPDPVTALCDLGRAHAAGAPPLRLHVDPGARRLTVLAPGPAAKE